MPTAYSATIQATAAKPWIVTHRKTGERYAYSDAKLAATRDMYARHGKRLETSYTIVNEYEQARNQFRHSDG